MATKKKVKNKVDFSDSISTFKSTAKKMNHQVQDVAEEFVDDIKESGGHLKDYAFEVIKENYLKTYNKVADTITIDNFRKTAKKVNDYTLKTADEMVDDMIENSEKWQKLAEKTVKGSMKLAAKQQEIVFDTLDTLKGQLSKSTFRLIRLFSGN